MSATRGAEGSLQLPTHSPEQSADGDAAHAGGGPTGAAVTSLLRQVAGLTAQNRFLERTVGDLRSQVRNLHAGVASPAAPPRRHGGSEGASEPAELAALQAGVDVLTAFGEMGFGVVGEGGVRAGQVDAGAAAAKVAIARLAAGRGTSADDPAALDAEAAASSLLPLTEVYPLAAARAIHAQGDAFHSGVLNARGMAALAERTGHHTLTGGEAEVTASGRAFREFVKANLGPESWTVPQNLGDIVSRALMKGEAELAGFSRADALRFARFTADKLSPSPTQAAADQGARRGFDRIKRLEREQVMDAGGVGYRDLLKLYLRIAPDAITPPRESAAPGALGPPPPTPSAADASSHTARMKRVKARVGSRRAAAPAAVGAGKSPTAAPRPRSARRGSAAAKHASSARGGAKPKKTKSRVRGTTVTGDVRTNALASVTVPAERLQAALGGAANAGSENANANPAPTGILQLMRDLRRTGQDAKVPQLFSPAALSRAAAQQMRTLLQRYAAAVRREQAGQQSVQAAQAAAQAAEERAREAEAVAVANVEEAAHLRQRLSQTENALKRMTAYATGRGALLEGAEEQLRRSKAAMRKLYGLLQRYARLPDREDEGAEELFSWA